MERRYYLGWLAGLSVPGCTERGSPTTRTPTPTTSTFGIHPVSEPEGDRSDIEVVSFRELTSEEQEFLDELLPEGGIECESRGDGWDSLIDTLIESSSGATSVYLKRDDDLYALYVSKADEVFVDTADYGEFPIADC